MDSLTMKLASESLLSHNRISNFYRSAIHPWYVNRRNRYIEFRYAEFQELGLLEKSHAYSQKIGVYVIFSQLSNFLSHNLSKLWHIISYKNNIWKMVWYSLIKQNELSNDFIVHSFYWLGLDKHRNINDTVKNNGLLNSFNHFVLSSFYFLLLTTILIANIQFCRFKGIALSG